MLFAKAAGLSPRDHSDCPRERSRRNLLTKELASAKPATLKSFGNIISGMTTVIARTIVFTEPGITSAGLSATDVVAICSFIVAVLALGASIAFAEVQRRHNIRVARPHVDIELGVVSYILRVTNHGPGVAKMSALSATIGAKSFNLLEISEFNRFCEWLTEIEGKRVSIQRNILTTGSYVAPGTSVDVISLTSKLSQPDSVALDKKVPYIAFDVSVLSLYERLYTDHHPAVKASLPDEQ